MREAVYDVVCAFLLGIGNMFLFMGMFLVHQLEIIDSLRYPKISEKNYICRIRHAIGDRGAGAEISSRSRARYRVRARRLLRVRNIDFWK